MSSIEEAITSWEDLWQLGCSAFNRSSGGPGLEALELILATLMYQRWALAAFEEGAFHLTIKENPDVTMADVATGSLPHLTDRHHVGAGMHLASASVRLPVAIHQIANICGNHADFDGLHSRQKEWVRARACRYLDGVQHLEHCSPSLSRPLSIVLLLLVRDEFAHGEESSGEDHWFRDRQLTLTRVHRCRLVEAQQVLARWAFDSMNRFKP